MGDNKKKVDTEKPDVDTEILDDVDLEKLNEISPEDIPVTEDDKNRNDGKWAKTFREALKVKQYAISQPLGLTQQAINYYEKRKVLSEKVLKTYETVLNLPEGLIKSMPNFEAAAKYFYDQSQNVETQTIHNLHFHPVNKIVELCQEKDELHREIIDIERTHKDEIKQMFENTAKLTNQVVEMMGQISKKL